MSTFNQILVTGGTGFIAQQVIYDLLNKGYKVNTTVRKLNKEDARVKALLNWEQNYPSKLTIFEADLMKQGSFDKSMEGCDAVLHIATPVLIKNKPKDPIKEQVEPAVEGTVNVLNSIAKTPSIKTIVVTSSVSSVFATNAVRSTLYTENDFNVEETIESCAYSYAKSRAEEKVWEFQTAHPNKYRICTINPGVVYGPLIGLPKISLYGKESNVALDHLKDYITGIEKVIPKGGKTYVDVRDVSQAHIAALELPNAHGRYICNHSTIKWVDYAKLLKNLVPDAPIPTELNSNEPEVAIPFFDRSKSEKELGIQYMDVKQSLKDMLGMFTDLPYKVMN